MDSGLLGEEYTEQLYAVAERLSECNSEHVYTMYEWLKSIYIGKNEPSKNEFDLDYPAYLADRVGTERLQRKNRKSGRMTSGRR